MALQGKVALVTGGGRGIGAGIARALARAGADIAIAEVDRVASAAQQYRDAALGGYQAARALVGEIEALGRRAIAISAGITAWSPARRSTSTAAWRCTSVHALPGRAGEA